MRAGRPRCFDEKQALENAMVVFWKNGFSASSLTDLTQAMGINKPSLYSTFGNKEALFIAALDHYVHQIALDHGSLLVTPKLPIRDRLRGYLLSIASMQCDSSKPGGCMLVTGACESACEAMPEKAKAALANAVSDWRRRVVEVLEAEEKNGLLPPKSSPKDLAAFLLALVQGMSVMARGGSNLAELTLVIDQAVRLF